MIPSRPRISIRLLTDEDCDELAYARTAEIEKAAKWCTTTNIKNNFINSIKQTLLADELGKSLNKLGLADAIKFGAVKRPTTLELLSSRQALELLECYYRSVLTITSRFRWNLFDLERAIAKERLQALTNKLITATKQP